jgi:hypothetical protein
LRKITRDSIIIVLLIATTLSAYWRVRGHDFVLYDDPLYVTKNEHVKDGLSIENVKWAFQWDTGSGNWHPLTWLSHMLDVELFGLKPGHHHMMSVAIHILNAILLFLVLRTMTIYVWPSAFVAGLFALHPLRVESVAWIAERKDVLSTFFGLLAMLAYAGYVRRPSVLRYVFTAVLFALSLMAKAMLVTLPFLLLLLDFWPLRRIGRTSQPADGVGGVKESIEQGPGWNWPTAMRLIIEKLPLLALSFAMSWITFKAQETSGAVEKLGAISIIDRIGNALVSYARYLGKTFWPVDLAVLYPHPGHWSAIAVAVAAVFLSVITIAAVLLARRHPYFMVGWLWFIGTLVPVIGLVQVGAQSMADRYTYFPLIGVFIVVAWGGLGLFGSYRWQVLAVAAVMALGSLWLSTRDQLRFWPTSRTLYQHAIDVTRDNWVMNMNMADVLETSGRDREAEAFIREAARIKPADSNIQFKIADTLVRQHRFDEAIGEFRRVLRIDPDHREALNGLAWFLATHPRHLDGPEALKLSQRACELDGYKDPGFLDTLAVAYAATGQFQQAGRTGEQAAQAAMDAGQPALAADIAKRLQLFRQRQPYIEHLP